MSQRMWGMNGAQRSSAKAKKLAEAWIQGKEGQDLWKQVGVLVHAARWMTTQPSEKYEISYVHKYHQEKGSLNSTLQDE